MQIRILYFLFSILVVGSGICLAQTLREIPLEDFPMAGDIWRYQPNNPGSGFSLKKQDDGDNWQFGELQFQEPGKGILDGITKTWIHEKMVIPHRLLRLAVSSDGQRVAGIVSKTTATGKKESYYLYETQKELIPWKSDWGRSDYLRFDYLRYDLQPDGTEELSVFFKFLSHKDATEQSSCQYVRGKTHVLKPQQMCYTQSYPTWEGKFFFQIQTRPEGTQTITGLPGCPSETWDAITEVAVGKHSNTFAFVTWSQTDGYFLWEYRHEKWEKQEVPCGFKISELRYWSNEDQLYARLQNDKEETVFFRPSKGSSVTFAPGRVAYHINSSQDDSALFACVTRTVSDGRQESVLIQNGVAIKTVPFSICDMCCSLDGKDFAMTMTDNEGNWMLERRGEILWKTPNKIDLYMANGPSLRFVACSQKGDLLHTKNQDKKQYTWDKGISFAGISPDGKKLLGVRQTNPGNPLYFICSNQKEQWGPFRTLNNLFFSDEGKFWIATVQSPESKKYQIVLNGQPVGQVYDNILSTAGARPGIHGWHTYGVIGDKWYRLEMDLDSNVDR